MAIDFVPSPGPEHERRRCIDYFLPETKHEPLEALEKKFIDEKEKLEKEKKEFEEKKAAFEQSQQVEEPTVEAPAKKRGRPKKEVLTDESL